MKRITLQGAGTGFNSKGFVACGGGMAPAKAVRSAGFYQSG